MVLYRTSFRNWSFDCLAVGPMMQLGESFAKQCHHQHAVGVATARSVGRRDQPDGDLAKRGWCVQKAGEYGCHLLPLLSFLFDRFLRAYLHPTAPLATRQTHAQAGIELNVRDGICVELCACSRTASSTASAKMLTPSSNGSAVILSGGAILTVCPQAPTGANSRRPLKKHFSIIAWAKSGLGS